MSSSDEERQVKAKKGGKKTDKKQEKDYQIKPSTGGPHMDTSNWPLLLKVKPNIINSYFNLIEL